MRSDDCSTSALAKLKDRCVTFYLFIFQKARFCQSKIYTGLLTAPWKVNNLVATLSPHQLSPPAKPTHRPQRCVFVLGRWGTNRALMEFEENITYHDHPRHEVAALPSAEPPTGPGTLDCATSDNSVNAKTGNGSSARNGEACTCSPPKTLTIEEGREI